MRLPAPVAFGASLLLAVTATGCTAGDHDESPVPSTTPTPVSVSAGTTSATTVTAQTTSAPITNVVVTIVPVSTVPATTSPPTTAASADAELAAAIQRDATAAEAALLTAIATPADPSSEALVRRYDAGDSLARVLEALTFLVENGLIGRPNPEVPSVLITGEPRPVDGTGSEIEVTTCRVDAAVILLPLSDDPNGPTAVYNDRITRTEATTRFSLADGIWRIEGGTTISESEGDTTCD